MNTNTKNALILGAGALAGIFVGRWAAPRIGSVLGLTLGPWGSAVGAALGGVLGAAMASKMTGEVEEASALSNLQAGAGLESD